MPYFFYQDPGHGWIAVKRQELIDLDILDQVSSCSYQRGDTVYLEEDCDASLFIQAKKAQGVPLKIIEKHSNNRSPIRSYEAFAAR